MQYQLNELVLILKNHTYSAHNLDFRLRHQWMLGGDPHDMQGFIRAKAMIALLLADNDVSALPFARTLFAERLHDAEGVAWVDEVTRVRAIGSWTPPTEPKVGLTYAEFTNFLDDHGYRHCLTYTMPNERDPLDRCVSLVFKGDELMVAKELFDDRDGPLGNKLNTEDEVLAHLMRNKELRFSHPLLYGKREVNGVSVIIKSFLPGAKVSSLAIKNKMTFMPAVIQMFARIANTMKNVHAAGVLMLDLKPENVLTNGRIFDFSHSRIIGDEAEVDAFITTPLYTAPEILTKRRASKASDVYSLGVTIFKTITWREPFEPYGRLQDNGPRVGELLSDALPCLTRGEFDPRSPICHEGLHELVRSMLQFDRSKRPTMEEVYAALAGMETTDEILPLKVERREFRKKSTPPIALVPMRASIPHAAHVDILCSLIDVGFDVVVPMQQAFLTTPDHPLPAWVSTLMMRALLEHRGYGHRSAKFVYGSFVPEQEHRLRFLMLPWWEHVSVVVTGNTEVHKLLGPIMEDRTFVDPLDLIDRTLHDSYDCNGTRLRKSIANEDTISDRFFPEPMRSIMSFDVMRERMEFVQQPDTAVSHYNGAVILHLPSDMGIKPFRLLPWEGPEEAIERRCRQMGIECNINPTFNGTCLRTYFGNERMFDLTYDGYSVSSDDDLHILYSHKE